MLDTTITQVDIDSLENQLFQKYIKEQRYPIYDNNQFLGYFTLEDFLKEEGSYYTQDELKRDETQTTLMHSWMVECLEEASAHALMCERNITH